MPDVLRVVHYLNAFFGGLGGEEEAHTPVSVQPGALGPGRLPGTSFSASRPDCRNDHVRRRLFPPTTKKPWSHKSKPTGRHSLTSSSLARPFALDAMAWPVVDSAWRLSASRFRPLPVYIENPGDLIVQEHRQGHCHGSECSRHAPGSGARGGAGY